MQQEVTDAEGITWTCVQALSGISDDAAQVNALLLAANPHTVLGKLSLFMSFFWY